MTTRLEDLVIDDSASQYRAFMALSLFTDCSAAMFSCVVYKQANKYKIEYTNGTGLGHGVYYKRIDDMPSDIRDKVKQLMWVNPNDQTLTESLGIRIGDNIFWVI